MALLMEDPNQTDETPRVPLPKTPVLITAATQWEARPLVEAPTPGAAIAEARARAAPVLLSRHILALAADFTVVGLDGLEFPRAYVLVTPAFARRAVEAIDEARVSLDGPQPVHDALRGRGSFAAAIVLGVMGSALAQQQPFPLPPKETQGAWKG